MKLPFNKFLPLLLLIVFCNQSVIGQMKADPVNAIIGDESYLVVHQDFPTANTDEILRIQTHLWYVEAKLRAASVEHLNEEQRLKRQFITDLLHQYWLAAQFPSNRDFPGERRPCFIDADGNICAVGYLLSETRGMEAANYINDRHQYDYLLDMNEPVLETWAAEYGLSLEECAMIQPTYGPPPAPQTSYAEIKHGYGISSAVTGGFNIAANIVTLTGKTTNRKWGYAGIVTGSGQLIMGIANLKKTDRFPNWGGGEDYTSYRSQNNLSYLNIAMGTATIVTSSLHLWMNKKKKERNSPLSFFSYPNEASSITMGLHFSHKF